MRSAVPALLVAADLALGAFVAHSLMTPAGDPAPPPPRASAPPTANAPSPSRAVDVTEILARPLFAETRRPPPAGKPDAAPPSAAPATLPRMTAILIDGGQRSAIFAGENGKPIVLSEGGRFGPFTVERIEPQQVTITGPEGKRIVHTRFDPNPAAVAPVLPPGMPAAAGFTPPGAAQPALPVSPFPMKPTGRR